MSTGSDAGSTARSIAGIDPTPVRYLVANGVDRDTAKQIVERATLEWQHGNTVITPMRAAMGYVATLGEAGT